MHNYNYWQQLTAVQLLTKTSNGHIATTATATSNSNLTKSSSKFKRIGNLCGLRRARVANQCSNLCFMCYAACYISTDLHFEQRQQKQKITTLISCAAQQLQHFVNIPKYWLGSW